MTHNKIDMAICLLLALLAIGCATPMATLHPDVKSYANSYPVWPDNNRSLANVDSICEYFYYKPDKLTTTTTWTTTAKYNNQGAMLHTKRHTTVSNRFHSKHSHCSEENFFDERGRLIRYEKMQDDTLFLVQTFAYNKRGQLVETTKQYQPTEYFIAEKWCYSYDRHGNQRSCEFYQNGWLTDRTHTRYNRKGRPLTEALYRGDGALLDSTIYTYNRHGDVIEERRILDHSRNRLGSFSLGCGIFDEAENERQQRHLWQKSHEWNFGWSPIQYDTIGTRYTYHSKGKQALKQVWWSEWGEEWRDKKRTVYNKDGGVAEKWEYFTHERNGKPYKREVYNSQGLLTSLYEHNWNCDTLTLKRRDEYNEQGAILRKNRETTVSKPYYTRSHNSHEENYFDNQGRLVRHENMRDDTLFMVQTFAYNKRGQLVETTKQYQPTEYFIAEKWCYSYDRHGNQRSCEFYQNGGLTDRTHTRYNRNGRPLTEAIYRGDGVLLDSTIYTYNRYGDVIEERRILEHVRNRLGSFSLGCGIFDEAENERQQRHLWQKSHEWNFGWSPIQHDTIATRYTYHSKGKQALKQVWWSKWGEEWHNTERTIYNPDGGVAEKWEYSTHERNGKPYKREVYNSQGLLTSLYEHNWNCDTLTLKRRDEYNEQGVLIRKIEYDTHYSKELREVYNDRGDLIERWQMLSDGTLSLTTKYNYEYVDSEGKCVVTKRNGKRVLPHPVSVTTTEIERLADGGTSKTKITYEYEDSGNVASVAIHKSVDSPAYVLSLSKYYQGEMTDENLTDEWRSEFFFRHEE